MKINRTLLKTKQRGFTIVELLIVVVIIGILAAIVVVAYNGITQQARDNVRKQDVAAIAKVLKLYAVDNGGLMSTGSGCGANDNGGGWFSYQGGSGYTTSINNCLIADGYMNSELLDPSGSRSCGGLNCHAYLISTCTQSSQLVTYIYANLETVGHTATDTDSTCSPSADTSIGANYYISIN